MIKQSLSLIIAVLISVCTGRYSENAYGNSRLSFTEFAVKYHHKVEAHDVVTYDGYILKVYHVIGDARQPVLLVHGIVDSADTFVIRGNASLVTALVKKGYDVWALNIRGNRYSRSHRQLNPDIDKRFWDFSFHEMGLYDLPAVIDYVLERTGQSQLSAIGHSQGNTIFYVMGSLRPEYNYKIKVLIALAPICFLEHTKPPVSALIPLVPIIDNILRLLGMEEVLNDNSVLRIIFEALCSNPLSYNICAHGIIFSVAGRDPSEFEPEFLPTLVAHYPTSTSRKNGVHVGQVALKKRFAQFDFGLKGNVAAYNATVPPLYDLRKVMMRVALFVGVNDHISSVRDSEMLRDSLPNVVDYRVLKYNRLNHLDHVWGRNMDKYLFPYIFKTLKVFN